MRNIARLTLDAAAGFQVSRITATRDSESEFVTSAKKSRSKSPDVTMHQMIGVGNGHCSQFIKQSICELTRNPRLNHQPRGERNHGIDSRYRYSRVDIMIAGAFNPYIQICVYKLHQPLPVVDILVFCRRFARFHWPVTVYHYTV
jgi:hypothetical protein